MNSKNDSARDDPTYNERLAEVYDQWFSSYQEAAIDALAELAGTGRALELGIGTGLIALPLAERGIEVHGIDSSAAMVSRLRAKPRGDAIPVTMGDFADVSVEGEFSLIFVVFNTFFALQSQREQTRCFRNAAAHLGAGGVFLIETFIPDASLFGGERSLKITAVTNDRASLKASEHDPVEQRIRSQHIVFVNNEIKLYPVEVRYAWPAELDLMAELAGLKLRHRWEDWNRGKLNARSQKHISVYERIC